MSESLNQNPFEDLAEECGVKFRWLVEYCHDGIWWADQMFDDAESSRHYTKREINDPGNLSSAHRISRIAIIESETFDKEPA